MTVATIALSTITALPSTALADHDTPTGEGLLESPFTLTCDGEETPSRLIDRPIDFIEPLLIHTLRNFRNSAFEDGS